MLNTLHDKRYVFLCHKDSSLVRLTLKKESGETVYKKIGTAGMLVAPIKSLAFDSNIIKYSLTCCVL